MAYRLPIPLAAGSIGIASLRPPWRSVEVVKGGVSDLYGGDALGGVINIIPRRPLDSSLSLLTFYGNKQTPDASVTASLRRGSWLALFPAEGFHTDGYVSVLPPLRGTVDTPVASEHLDGQFIVGASDFGPRTRVRQRFDIRRRTQERHARSKQ